MSRTNEKNNLVDNLSRLAWACRRGMLELDVLLGNFLKKGYLSLPLADKQAFIDLLNYPDPELFAWLLGQTMPTDKGLANIIYLIRAYAQPQRYV